MPIVYRIEKRGTGPYHFKKGTFYKALLEAHHENDSRLATNETRECPGNLSRFEMMFTERVMCNACPSLEALQDWFTGFFEAILANGFKVYQVEVPEFYLCPFGKQGIYFKDKVIKRKVVKL